MRGFICIAALICGVGATPSVVRAADDLLPRPACDADDASQVRLQIQVNRMRSPDGSINVTIYPDDSAHFLHGKYKIARQIFRVVQPLTTFCIVLPAPGYYAVALFHDENENRHFDTNFLGIPVEGYGFSNNPRLSLGPPPLKDARFSAHTGDNPISISLTYYLGRRRS